MNINKKINNDVINVDLINSDFKVNIETGEAYISQRKAAELLGISQSSIRDFCHSRNLVVEQGLSSEILGLATQYYALDARKTTSEAKALLKQITTAGVKAYLYHMAGYEIKAVQAPISSKSQLEMLAEGFASMALLERQQKEIKKIQDQHTVQLTEIKAKQSAILDQSDYYSVIGYANLVNVYITLGQSSGISRMCNSLSTELAVGVQQMVDPRFGKVNIYHKSILETIFKKKKLII